MHQVLYKEPRYEVLYKHLDFYNYKLGDERQKRMTDLDSTPQKYIENLNNICN